MTISAKNTRTVKVTGLRVIPSENADVAFVAKWVNADGKPKSRTISRADVKRGATANLAAGTLTLPVGKRGRKAAPGMAQAQLDALLAGISKA